MYTLENNMSVISDTVYWHLNIGMRHRNIDLRIIPEVIKSDLKTYFRSKYLVTLNTPPFF